MNIAKVCGGVLFGLLVVSILAIPLSLLSDPLRIWLAIITSITAIYAGIMVCTYRLQVLISLIYTQLFLKSKRILTVLSDQDFGQILLDTSAILDGRVLAIAEAGWITRTLLVTRFTVADLQNRANSDNTVQSRRGKYGLEILTALQKERRVSLTFIGIDLEKMVEAEDKLLFIANLLNATLMTNNTQLMIRARLQDISAININDVDFAASPIFLPDEQDYPQNYHLHF